MDEMAEHDEFFSYCGINNLTKLFQLPLNVYLDCHAKGRKYITEILLDGSKFSYYEHGIYTDIPSAGVEIENYFYYVSISENPRMFTPVPEEYEDKIKIILDFISKYYEILLLHWKRKISDFNLCDFITTIAVAAPPESEEEYQYRHTCYNNISRRLRKLKKAKKFSGSI